MEKMARYSKLQVLLGTAFGLTLAGLPFLNATVREREEAVHRMRDESYDESMIAKASSKDSARNARLSIRRHD